LKDTRAYFIHSNENLLRQKIYQIIAGYSEDDAADQLTKDPVFSQILGTASLVSQPSLSRFFRRFDQQSIELLEFANQELLEKVNKFRESEGHPKALIFDLDSTHSDTYGNQEDVAYNSNYGTVGYHPLVDFDGVLNFVLEMCIPLMV
jgi:hypothetical protein